MKIDESDKVMSCSKSSLNTIRDTPMWIICINNFDLAHSRTSIIRRLTSYPNDFMVQLSCYFDSNFKDYHYVCFVVSVSYYLQFKEFKHCHISKYTFLNLALSNLNFWPSCEQF